MTPSRIPLRSRAMSQQFLLATTVGFALFAGFASVAFAGEPAAARAPLTRAEVRQDFDAYRASGLADLESDDTQSRVGTPAWQAARGRYLALRHMMLDPATGRMLSRAEVVADLKHFEASGLAAFGRHDGDDFETRALQDARARYDVLAMNGMMQDRPLSRAEVLADLQIYRESGLAEFDRGEGASASELPGYQAAQARYAALRTGGRYIALVKELRERGSHAG